MDVGSVRGNRRTWEAIAPSFDATRTRPWGPVVEFLHSLGARSRVLDAGCGNGRHLTEAVAAGHVAVGLDFSVGLMRLARGHVPTAMLVAGLIERPPVRPQSFDAVVAAASVHHVRGRPARVEAWRGLREATRQEGSLLATVWMLDQPRFRTRPPRLPDGPAETGDAVVDWTQHGMNESRFIHLYREHELTQELTEAGWHVEREWSAALGGTAPDNWLAQARA